MKGSCQLSLEKQRWRPRGRPTPDGRRPIGNTHTLTQIEETAANMSRAQSHMASIVLIERVLVRSTNLDGSLLESTTTSHGI